jgi:hypothetical protein
MRSMKRRRALQQVSDRCSGSGRLRRQGHAVRQPELRIALAAGVVKINQVVIGHPNGGQSNAAGSAETKLQTTHTLAADQSELGGAVLIVEQVFFLTQSPVNEASQIVQRPDFVNGRVHWVDVRL